MIREYSLTKFNRRLFDRPGWCKLPLTEDIVFLTRGQAAFSTKEKEMLSCRRGYYRLKCSSAQKALPISELVKAVLELTIVDLEKNKVYRTEID